MSESELRAALRVFRSFRKKYAQAKTVAAERKLLAEFRSYVATLKGGDDDGA